MTQREKPRSGQQKRMLLLLHIEVLRRDVDAVWMLMMPVMPEMPEISDTESEGKGQEPWRLRKRWRA